MTDDKPVAMEGGCTCGAVRYRLTIADRMWSLFYAPVARAVEASAKRVVRLQSGNIRVYLGWTLATLVVLLWIMS